MSTLLGDYSGYQRICLSCCVTGKFAVLSVLLASCVSAPVPVKRISFPHAEYAALANSGTAVISGQAFLRTRGGDVKTAAGAEVLLNPVTSYSRQWYEVAYLRSQPMTEPDSRYVKYIRTTTADADGRFSFSSVPPGNYYVVTQVVWEAPSRYGLYLQGGHVAKMVAVKDDEKVDVIVTR